MRKLYAFFLFAWLALSWAFSPPEASAQVFPRWDSRLGGAGTDSLSFMLKTDDGGYLIGGSSNSNAGSEKSQNRRGAFDYWVARLRPDGSRLWDRTFGGTNDDFLKTAVPYQNGFLLLGKSNSNANGDKTVLNKGGFDIWAIYIDASGNRVWDRSYGGSADEDVAGAQPVVPGFNSGNFILAGSSASNISGDKSQNSKGGLDYWIVQIDPNGTKINDLTVGGQGDDVASAIINSPAVSKFIGGSSTSGISGDKTSANRGLRDYWVVRLDTYNPLSIGFQGSAGGSGDDVLASLVRMPNSNNGGNVMAFGSSNSPISGDKTQGAIGDYDYWLVHFNASWTIANQKVLGSVGRDWAVACDSVVCKSQGYLSGTSSGTISGNKTNDAPGTTDNWIVKIDNNLNPLFNASVGGPATNSNAGIKLLSDGSFIIGSTITGGVGGAVTSGSRGVQDYWIGKYELFGGVLSRGEVNPRLTTVCSGNNSGRLRLSNFSERIAGWEMSTMANFVNRTFVNNLTDSILYQNLTQTTFYRALTYNDGCGFLYSDSAEVRVVLPPNPANAGPDESICMTPNFYTRFLPRPQVGAGSWTQLSGPNLGANTSNGDSLRVRFVTAGDYRFVYQVVSPPCPDQRDTLMIHVDSPSLGGHITSTATTVCVGAVVTLTLNNSNGATRQWERQPDCMGAFTPINGANGLTLQTPPLQDTVCYRVSVQNGVCPAVFSDTIRVNVGFIQPGQLNSAQSVCAGQNSGILQLIGSNATVLRWEKSLDANFLNVTPITNTAMSYIFSNLSATTWFRVVLSSPQCQQGYSPSVKVTVGQPTVGGTVTGPVLVCSGQPFDTLRLVNHVGDVLFWEKSTNGGQTWTSIANTNNWYNASPLQITTAFRAVVKSPGCLERRSQQVTITVQPGPVAGTLSAPRTFCAGQNSGILSLSGFSGRIVRWEKTVNDGANWSTITNTLNSLTYSGLTQTTCFKVFVSSNACPNVQVTSNVVCIAITPLSNGGTITGPQAGICAGQPVNDTLRLTNHIGNVIRWERSTNNFVNFTTIGNTTNRLVIPNNLTQNTQYRAVVQSGQCATALSQVYNLVVSQPSVGGTVTPAQTVTCSGGGTGQLVLTGYVGSIVRWEFSTDGGLNYTPIVSTLTSLTYTNLTRSTCFRAVVKNGACPEAYSTPGCVTVDAGVGGGRVFQDATVCYGANGASMALTGYNGSVIRWESSTDNFQTITTLPVTVPIHFYQGLTQTTKFRAVVQSGNCTGVSIPATITVLPQAQGGFVGGATTVCAGTNNGQVVLTGHTGEVSYWESSTDNFQSNFTALNNTTTTQNFAGLTRTTCYRAYVHSGPCLPAVSQPACITVAPQDVANAGPDQNICGTTATLTGNVPNGGVGVWQFISGPAAAFVIQNGNNADAIGLLPQGCYVFRYQITNFNNQFCPISHDDVEICAYFPTDTRINTNDTSLCVTDTLRLSGSGNGTPMWQFMEGSGTFTNASSFNPTVRNLAFGRNRIVLTTFDPNQACPSTRDTITIWRAPQSVASTVRSLSGDTVCIGSTVRFLAERPRVGDIVRWEWSTDPFFAMVGVTPSTDTIYNHPNVQTDIYVRYVVKSGSCPAVISQPKRVVVRTQPTRGFMRGDTAVCASSYGGVMELTNYTGNIVRWEQSFDNFQTVTSISNTSRFHQFSTTRNVCFRAILQNLNCPTVFSDTACVGVGGGVPALVTASDTSVCSLGNQGILTATGFTGNIIRWESRPDGNPNWTSIANTASVQAFNNLTVRTCFRAVTQFNNCTPLFSNAVCVNVTSQSIAGVLTPTSTIVCSGSSVLLTLSNNVGRVIRWEESPNAGQTWSTISNTLNTYNARPTVRTWYRAVVQNGNCPQAISNFSDVDVQPAPSGGVIIGNQSACGGNTDTLRLVQYQGQILQWERAFDPNFFSAPTTIQNTNDVLAVQLPNVNQPVYFRVKIRNGACEVYSQVFAVLVSQGPSAPVVTRSQAVICYGLQASLIADGSSIGRFYWYDANNNLLTPNGLVTGQTFPSPPITQNNTCFTVEYRQGNCISPRATHCVMFDPNMPSAPTFTRLDSVICVGETATVRPASQNATQYIYSDANNNVIDAVFAPGQKSFSFTASGVYTFYVQGMSNNCPGPKTQFRIRVGGGQDGGLLSGVSTACVGQNVTLVLQNFVGQIIRWESSTDNFLNVNTINNFSNVLNVANIQRTTGYRAVVQGCGFHLSNVLTVNVSSCNPEAISQQTSINRCTDSLTVTGIRTRFNQFTNVFISTSPTLITNVNWVVTDIELFNDELMKIRIPGSVPNGGPYFVIVENGDGLNNNTWPLAVRTAFTLSGGPCGNGRLLIAQPNVVNTCQNPMIQINGDSCSFGTTTNVWLSTSNTSIVGNNRATIQEIVNDNVIRIRVPNSVPSGTYFIIVENGGLSQPNHNFPVPIQITIDSPQCPDAIILSTNPTTANKCDTSMVLVTGQNTTFTTLSEIYLSERSDTLIPSLSFRVTNFTIIADDLLLIRLPQNIIVGGYFIYVVNGGNQSGPPPRNYPLVAPIFIEESPTPGQAMADDLQLCSGETTDIWVQDHIGSVIRWERSTDGFVNNITVVPNETRELFSPMGIFENVCYRAIISAGTCPEAPSQPVCIQVLNAGAGGRVTPALTEICSGTQLPTLRLENAQLGQVIRWEASNDGFNSATSINNVTTSFTPQGPLNGNVCFRAVVSSGQGCNEVYAQAGCINVGSQSFGGNASIVFQQGNSCPGENITVIRTVNYLGTIRYWEASTTNFQTVTRVNVTLDSLVAEDLAQFTCFRAVVQSGGCPETRSNSVCVNVAQSLGTGAIAGAGTVCSGGSRTLTLTGNQRPILGWESSTDCNTFLNPISIPTNTQSISSGNLTESTCFRAVVQGVGNCAYGYSPPVQVRVSTLKIDTIIVTPVSGCGGGGSMKVTASGGTTPYTYSIVPANAPANNTGVFTGLPSGNYTVTVRDFAQCAITRTNVIIAPAQLDTLRITGVSNITITSSVVSWTPVSNPNGVVYRLRYRVAGSLVWTEVTTTATSRLISGLQDGTTYEVQVRYECANGDFVSPWSEISAFATASSGANCGSQVKPAPSGIFVSAIGTRSVTVQWSAVLGAGGYIVAYGPLSQNPNNYQTILVCAPNTSLTITNLLPNTDYQFRVRTNCGDCNNPNGVNLSAFSLLYPFRTLQLRDEEALAGEISTPTLNVSIYPNPNKGNFSMSFNAEEVNETELNVLDVTGRLVYSRRFAVQSGMNELPVELEGITSGIYAVQFRMGNTEQITKVIVE